MKILYLFHPLNGLLMVVIPIILALYLTHRFKLSWGLWWIGAGTFVLSQVGHIPFNYVVSTLLNRGSLPLPPEKWRMVFFPLLWGLSAGMWEEWARYAMYRWWAKDARSWRKGLLAGAGHGGIEAILLGVLVLYAFVQLVSLQGVDLASIVPADRLPQVVQQVATYWSMNWYDSLLGTVERIFTIPFHIAASLIVMQAFTRGKIRWVWLAVFWHTLIDAGIAGYAAGQWMGFTWGPYALEGLLGLTALFNLWVIYRLYQPEPPEPIEEMPPLPPPELVSLPAVEETPENLDKTRYNL